SVLSETEKELGVAVADMGAGTIDLAMFVEGSPLRTSVLPIGGNNVTNDVALGLKTSLQVAEDLKIQHGTCNLAAVGDEEEITVGSGTRCEASFPRRMASRSSTPVWGGRVLASWGGCRIGRSACRERASGESSCPAGSLS